MRAGEWPIVKQWVFDHEPQASGFGPKTLPPTCPATAALFNVRSRVRRLDIIGPTTQSLSCEVSAMMVMTPALLLDKGINQVPRTCLQLPITSVHHRRSHHRLGAGGGPELRSLPVFSFVGFRESPLPLLIWSPHRGQLLGQE